MGRNGLFAHVWFWHPYGQIHIYPHMDIINIAPGVSEMALKLKKTKFAVFVNIAPGISEMAL